MLKRSTVPDPRLPDALAILLQGELSSYFGVKEQARLREVSKHFRVRLNCVKPLSKHPLSHVLCLDCDSTVVGIRFELTLIDEVLLVFCCCRT